MTASMSMGTGLKTGFLKLIWVVKAQALLKVSYLGIKKGLSQMQWQIGKVISGNMKAEPYF